MRKLIDLIGVERIVRFVNFIDTFNPTPSFYFKYWLFIVAYTGVWTAISRAIW